MKAATLNSAGESAADRLLDATLRSIHLHGLHGTTVTTVAQLSGLSRGMVRHEFGSKNAMVVAAMRRLCAGWVATTEPDPTLSAVEQVRWIVRAMFAPDVFTPVAVDAWLSFTVAARSDAELCEVRSATQDRWLRQLEKAFAGCGVSSPTSAANAVLAAADGLWLRQRVDEQQMSRVEAESTVLAVAEALLATTR